MSEKGLGTPALMSNQGLKIADAVQHLNDMTQKQRTPAVLRVVRRVGAMNMLQTKQARRASCLPLRAGEWAQIMEPPFQEGGESCIKIKYADGAERVFRIEDFVWDTVGMDKVRNCYILRKPGDRA